MVEAVLEVFFNKELDADEQAKVCSSSMTARFLHSWPTEKTMGKEDFFAFQRAIQEGIPDWDYRAKIWKPPATTAGGGGGEGALPDSAFETTERGNLTVYVVIDVVGTHTGTLNIFDDSFPPSDPPIKIQMPKELVKIGFTTTEPLHIDSYESWKIIEAGDNNTGNLGSIPGVLHALGRPLPPPATDILTPIPPYTAADNRDPNFKLRIQVFKQIVQKAHKGELKELLVRQKGEIQQYMDYLNSIRNYTIHDSEPTAAPEGEEEGS